MKHMLALVGLVALLALVGLVALGISSRPAQQPDVSALQRVVCRPDQDLETLHSLMTILALRLL